MWHFMHFRAIMSKDMNIQKRNNLNSIQKDYYKNCAISEMHKLFPPVKKHFLPIYCDFNKIATSLLNSCSLYTILNKGKRGQNRKKKKSIWYVSSFASLINVNIHLHYLWSGYMMILNNRDFIVFIDAHTSSRQKI